MNEHDSTDDGREGTDDGEPGASPGDEVSGDGTEADERRASRRRWLVRILVALGLGIPIVIEGATFVELIRSRLFGEDETPTATPTETGVGVGDELLPATDPAETISEARLVASDEQSWTFTLSVAVDNATETVYELRLGAVTNAAGERIEGGATTGRIQPGETGYVTASWAMPPNVRPATVQVTAVVHGGDGVTPGAITDSVSLGRVPVSDPETATTVEDGGGN